MTMAREQTTAQPLILVVDDYPDSREMCAEYLGVCGFRVEQAADGAEAVRKAAGLLPDAILMDVTLPDMDGMEATRRIKADGKTAGILVIALTGHGGGDAAENARAAGCDSFLVKPCPPDAMVDEIRRLLALKEERR